MINIIVIPLPFQHNFFQNFENLFSICVKKFNKIQSSQLLGFETHTSHDSNLKLGQSRHTKLFHNIDKVLFDILYNHYLLKISKLKNH